MWFLSHYAPFMVNLLECYWNCCNIYLFINYKMHRYILIHFDYRHIETFLIIMYLCSSFLYLVIYKRCLGRQIIINNQVYRVGLFILQQSHQPSMGGKRSNNQKYPYYQILRWTPVLKVLRLNQTIDPHQGRRLNRKWLYVIRYLHYTM